MGKATEAWISREVTTNGVSKQGWDQQRGHHQAQTSSTDTKFKVIPDPCCTKDAE